MTTKEIIRDFISSELLDGARGTPVGDEDQLIENGIIDSLGIMSLLSFVEERFSMQIPGDDLMPENFASISAITALVDRRMAG
ncbi:MAG: acyl carrier protein [Omnitrophica WOR_2 bacterium]